MPAGVLGPSLSVTESFGSSLTVYEQEFLRMIGPVLSDDTHSMAHWSGHCFRVARWAYLTAAAMGASLEWRMRYNKAAFLHDWGKRSPELRHLFEPNRGRYTEPEKTLAEQHGYIGARLAQEALGLDYGMGDDKRDPVILWHILAATLTHHVPFNKCLDAPTCAVLFPGQPYEARSGKSIPLIGRIVAVVDTYDALTEDRGYKRTWSKKDACLYLMMHAGTRYDPEIVNAFVKKVLQVRFRWDWFSAGMFPLKMAYQDLVFALRPRIKKLFTTNKQPMAGS